MSLMEQQLRMVNKQLVASVQKLRILLAESIKREELLYRQMVDNRMALVLEHDCSRLKLILQMRDFVMRKGLDLAELNSELELEMPPIPSDQQQQQQQERRSLRDMAKENRRSCERRATIFFSPSTGRTSSANVATPSEADAQPANQKYICIEEEEEEESQDCSYLSPLTPNRQTAAAGQDVDARTPNNCRDDSAVQRSFSLLNLKASSTPCSRAALKSLENRMGNSLVVPGKHQNNQSTPIFRITSPNECERTVQQQRDAVVHAHDLSFGQQSISSRALFVSGDISGKEETPRKEVSKTRVRSKKNKLDDSNGVSQSPVSLSSCGRPMRRCRRNITYDETTEP